MTRKLKYHESRLLRKHNFVEYKQDNGHRDAAIVRRYMLQKPEDYHKYNRMVGVRKADKIFLTHILNLKAIYMPELLTKWHSQFVNSPTD
jgi:hypothetical protein